MTHIPKDSLMLLSRRRVLGRLVLGRATYLASAGTAQEKSPGPQVRAMA